MNETKHARCRARQRGIPRHADRLLEQYGDRMHDHHGAVRVFFGKRGRRRLRRADCGLSEAELDKVLRVYRVEDARSGRIITRGWKTRHFRRP